MKVSYNTKYDYEYCLNEAKKYTILQDFKKFSPEAARSARYRGWLDEYTWLISRVKPKGYWNEETCREEALKHDTVASFHDNSGGAYTVALANGWLDRYIWLKRGSIKKGFYTKELCEAEARKYTFYADFKNLSRSYYEQAKKHGWINEYTWLIRQNMPKGYWNEERCRERALKYKSYIEFRKNDRPAYNKSKKNGWLEKFDWLEVKTYVDLDEVCDNVYVYLFEDFKSVYVGRTKHPERRHKEHTKYCKKDTIYKFIEKYGIDIPVMTILESNVSISEGLYKEDQWVNWYKEHGYTILNKANTGKISGSVGGFGCGKSKWTYDACYEEAKKYKTRTEFARKKNCAYIQAIKNGWIDEYIWFERIVNKYTIEEAIVVAKKYKTIRDFRKNDLHWYNACKKKGWLDGFDWIKKSKLE